MASKRFLKLANEKSGKEIPPDWMVRAAMLELELDEFHKNNLDEILEIAAEAKRIRKEWGYK